MNPDQKIPLLISGSRHISQAGLIYAENCVGRAKMRGDMYIVVGDAAGVDTAVICACNQYNVPYVCYGIDEQPRCADACPYICLENTIVALSRREAFRQRDILMVRHIAENKGQIMVLWNGTSNGSYHVWCQGILKQVQTYLKIFK